MAWIAALFGKKEKRGQTITSTHDAFSLPTHSPTTAHPDAFTPPTYTYPPSTPTYGYLSTRDRSSSLLPMHAPGPSTPETTWNRIRAWLNREYPELGDTLNYGILPQELSQIEMQFGFPLPKAVRDSYLVVNGQEAESAAGCSEGLFFGLTLLPLDEVYEEWRFWREVDNDPATGANERLREMMQSLPANWIRRAYSHKGWIPLIADKAGNYIGVDLAPDTSGSPGQVIVFGRDFDTKVVLWRGDGADGWSKWLANFADELESGDTFEIGVNSESEGSEDDIGYESYYHDGTGRGQGDGGGDSGMTGGLKLIGEYRGWNVMEAWADRSLRRWYEAGVINDTSVTSTVAPSHAAVSDIDLGALKITEHAAEVPIPVISDEALSSVVPQASSSTRERPTRSDVPTISITKPPAPLPVELPTPRDIMTALPSPPDSTHKSSFDEDLESGRRPRADSEDVPEEEAILVSNRFSLPPAPPTPERAAPISAAAPLPASPVSLVPISHKEEEEAPDLLGDLTNEPQAQVEEELVDTSDTGHEALATIKLVGQMPGATGVSTLQEDQENISEKDFEEISAPVIPESTKKAHKKTKSGLSLKKFTGGRKKGSDDSSK